MSYDEPKILSSQLNQFCLIGVDGGQSLLQPQIGLSLRWSVRERGSVSAELAMVAHHLYADRRYPDLDPQTRVLEEECPAKS